MNIVLSLPNFKTAGSQYVVIALYQYYRSQGHQTYILIDDPDTYYPESIDKKDQLSIPKQGYLSLRKGLRYRSQLKKLLQKLNIDILHSWDYRSECWEAMACKTCKTKYVYTKKNNAWSKKWFLKSFLSTHIAYDQPQMKKAFFSSFWLRSKLSFIPHGIDLERFQMKDKEKTMTIGCIGNINENKNQLLIIEAMHEIDLKINLELYGKWDDDYKQLLDMRIEEYQLEDRVHFKGYLENQDIAKVLTSFDAFVLASYNEGLPVCLIEAMACGTYCIASYSGGGSEYLLKNGTLGKLFYAHDAKELSTHLQDLYQDPERIQTICQLAREQVEKHFTLEREGQSYLDLFKNLMA